MSTKTEIADIVAEIQAASFGQGDSPLEFAARFILEARKSANGWRRVLEIVTQERDDARAELEQLKRARR